MMKSERICRLAISIAATGALALCAGALLPAVAAAAGGSIEGEVKKAGGSHEAIKGICVTASPTGGSESSAPAETNSEGRYRIGGLAAGEYRVRFGDCPQGELNFAPRFYNEGSKQSEAQPVRLGEGETRSGISALMYEGGEIFEEGVLGGKAQKLQGVCVDALPIGEGEGGFATTNELGEFTIRGLATGEYIVEFESCGKDVVRAFYLKEEVGGGRSVTGTRADASHVSVTAGSEPEIPFELPNVRLEAGAEIEGTLTNAEGKPVDSAICVQAEPASGSGEDFFASSIEGHYKLEGLATGSYHLHFEQCHAPGATTEWASQYYNGAATAGEAAAISVSAGAEPAVPALANVKLLSTAAIKPANTGAPVISGTPAAGDTLTCSSGTWTGSPTPTYSYQWLLEGAAIPGASASTYAVQPADEGHSLSCRVTASNEAGSASAASSALAVPRKTTTTTTTTSTTTAPPASGTAQVNRTATVKSGTAAIRLSCNALGPCRGTVKLIARVTVRRHLRRHGKRRVVKRTVKIVVGTASFSIEKGARQTLHLRLDAGARAALRKAGKRGLTVQVSGNDIKSGTLVLREARAQRKHGKHARHRKRA